MIRWMCGVKVTDRFTCSELRERLGINNTRLRLRWHGHVLTKDWNDWMKKCIDFEVEGVRPRRRLKNTWSDIIEKDCQT